MARIKSNAFFSKNQIFFAITAGVGLVAGGMWGITTLQRSIAIKKAELQIQNGWGALAVETLEPHRRHLVRSESGCRLLVGVYFQTRSQERLEWTSQSCLENRKEIHEVFIGLAASREITGRDSEALQILGSVTARFNTTPDILYRMATIFRRNKRDNEAVITYLKAAERAPEAQQLSMEALEYFSTLEKWTEARQMAERLKAVKTDNPEIALIIARALERGGDPSGAQKMVGKARELLSEKPADFKANIEQAYADVLKGAPLAGQTEPTPPARKVASESSIGPNKRR